MRADVSLILIAMGFESLRDFTASQVSPTNVEVTWLSAQPMPTEAEIDAFALANPDGYAQRLLTNDRAELITWLTNGPLPAKLMRALMLVLLDELNLHAEKLNAILTAIDNGSSLAQVKSNIAAIADYPQRTKANLITALTSTITAGDADA